ncbi:hypothetical protein B484DRAFT_452314 [Ochromonadaceae sp. CCMP2298]|nr:hypothetical protein B484DRAFT_452314 [Ochromonadaceae sp. CCMP2298]
MKPGARRKSSSVGTLTLFAVGIAMLVVIIVVFNYKNDVGVTTNERKNAAMQDYKQLLGRAKQLQAKYKDLTGASQLPDELSIAAAVEVVPTPVTLQRNASAGSLSPVGPSAASTDLVLGMAQDTDPKNFAVFCKSLRSVSTASVIVFVNTPIPQQHQLIAKEQDITLVGFEVSSLEPAFLRKYHPSTLRWQLFHQHFQQHPELRSRFKRVWMIDVRDSFFQRDPFEFVSRDRPNLHVFNGVEGLPLKQCGWNGGWVRDCFSAPVLQSIGNKGIICSGVSAGSAASAFAYVQIMSDLVSGKHQPSGGALPEAAAEALRASRFPSCERNGVDQGAHNVLVHTGALKHLHLQQWGQRDGPVANMQSRLLKIAASPERGLVVRNSVGAEVHVVHQYDRYPDLQKHLFEKYVDWVKTGDLGAEWAYEKACTPYSYAQDVDLFKGVCDLKNKGGITGAASCCEHCAKLKGQCKGFTFFAGACFLKSCGKGPNTKGGKLLGAVSGYLK